MPDGAASGWRAQLAPLIRPILRYASVMGIKATNIATGFIVTLLLARAGGPEVLGSYTMAIQTAQLASILAVVGCDQLALREVAAHLRLGEKATANSHMRYYLRFVTPLAVLVAGLFAGGVMALQAAGLAAAQQGTLIAATGFVAANAFYLMGLGIVRGLGDAVRAQAFDGLFTVPLALGLGLLLLAGGHIAAVPTVIAATACLVASMALLFFLVWRKARDWGHDDSILPPSPWQEGTPMMLISFLMFFAQWLPQFLAGTLGSAGDAGAFRAAWQLAMPFAVVQTTAAMMISPQISGDLRQGRRDAARRRLRRNRYATLASTLPIALPLLIWPKAILTLIFGAAFAGTAPLLQWLVGANMLAILAGASGAVITMSGRSRETVPVMILAAALMAILAFLLVPRFGITGLAMAYAAGHALRVGQGYWLTRRILALPPGST
ncbi:lipopolysaccharide biosynthesis protein [Sandarakinorhabdus oryzae]|uniref:lipopolysaccharide biosynthesis protein n=1 Tax=Sandarakinorhabdus oryzae TaxID=2675220 RepID=UPI0012E157A3|nr:polysaccharide biosynthesis C-terminal domain-containing protein [Sandarakinorhabdus oryzae]